MACSPAEPVLGCVPDTFLGVCPRCHRFVLRLQNLFSPIPRPALAERSSHAGEGGNLKFIFARGFALASPHCAGRDTVYRVGFRCRRSACPRRCLLDPPRGRGPSQTPPSLQRRIVPSPPVPPLLGCPFPEGSRNLFVAEGAPSPVPRKVTRTRAAPGASLGTWQPPGKSKPRGFSRGDARGETPCIPMPVPEGLLADRRFAGNAGAIPLRVL